MHTPGGMQLHAHTGTTRVYVGTAMHREAHDHECTCVEVCVHACVCAEGCTSVRVTAGQTRPPIRGATPTCRCAHRAARVHTQIATPARRPMEMCTRACARVNTYLQACVHAEIHEHTCIRMDVRTDTQRWQMHIWMRTYMEIDTREGIRLHTWRNTYVHTKYAHTHAHSPTHTNT